MGTNKMLIRIAGQERVHAIVLLIPRTTISIKKHLLLTQKHVYRHACVCCIVIWCVH